MRRKWIISARVAGLVVAMSPTLGCGDQRGGADAGRGLHPDAEDTRGQGIVPDGSPPDIGDMADPGLPQVEFGAKGEAHLFLGDAEVGYIFFAVLAPEQVDLAHVFFLPEHRASVGVTEYYVSLVLDRATWRAGVYSGALAGRAAITLSNGAEYQSNATEASVTASLTSAAAIQGCMYLDGQLTMILAAKSGGEPLRVEVNWN